jgi:translation initiation factor IF-1
MRDLGGKMRKNEVKMRDLGGKMRANEVKMRENEVK